MSFGLLRAMLVATGVLAAFSLSPAHAAADWRSYVPGPATPNVAPVKVVAVSGDVTNPAGLIDPRLGPTTLVRTPSGPVPTILLDYGKDVGGQPYFTVTAASGLPTLRSGYSEAQQFAGDKGDEPDTTFLPRPGVDPHRYNEHIVLLPGTINESAVQGGQRFQYLTLASPGRLTLSSVGIHFTAFRATPQQYQGYFLSSDDQLNRIWYAGAYTAQLDMAPAGPPDGGSQPVIFDGAKRDRLVWIGDLVHQIPTVALSLGSNGNDYTKQSLAVLGRFQNILDGSVPGLSFPDGPGIGYSASYSTDYVLNLASYFRYTADTAFVEQQYPTMKRELAYDRGLVNQKTGLLTIGALGGLAGYDWDYYDGAKTGAVTAFNVIYYRALLDGAYVADGLGYRDAAVDYRKQAAELAAAINGQLYNPATGVYDISDQKRGTIAQDANALAILYGVAPADRTLRILRTLRQKLWIQYGSLPFSADSGYSDLVSPFAGGFEVNARFAAGDEAGAYALLRNEWGHMIAPGPAYTGAFWENFKPDGTVPTGATSLAHGWASGPTASLTEYVLGIQPIRPGYQTWRIAPRPGELAWAQGQVPTAYGPLRVKWSRHGSGLTIQVTVPAGTSGTVVLPGSRLVTLAKAGTYQLES